MKQVDLNAINSPQTHQTQRGDCARPTNGSPTNVGSTKSTAVQPQPDQVEVSTLGMEIGQLVERAKSLPDVRSERVEALRELVRSGRYEVASTTIAEAILRDEF